MVQHPEVLQHADDKGNTPMHLASIGGHQPVIRLLLKASSDINVKNVGLVCLASLLQHVVA
jgi:ankyrin repeat protein